MSDEAEKPEPSDIILERVTKLHSKLIDLSLDRTPRLLEALGHPERALPPTIHIAGTNGKGSTSAFLRAMLEAAGYGVHSYTSPHLVRFHERIRLAGHPRSAPISEAELSRLLDECEKLNAGHAITFFEITTCMAFLAFARHQADALILEVGMGGRYDTTNVIDHPTVTVITPVDYDHQQFLGETIGKIAHEKAGILKPGVPAVVGPQSDEGRDAIEAEAARVGAPLFIWGQDFSAHEEQGHLVYQDEGGLLDLPMPRLPGRHQIDNAAVAIAALRQARSLPVSETHIAQGLRNVEWPARLQRLTRGPLVARLPAHAELWLDGGHNPSAGRVIAHAMADFAQAAPAPLVMIVGMKETKDAKGFFDAFAGLALHVETVAIPDDPACLPPETLAHAAHGAGLDATPAPSIEAAIEAALAIAMTIGEMPRILICGSLYLAGAVLRENG